LCFARNPKIQKETIILLTKIGDNPAKVSPSYNRATALSPQELLI